ncbi:MAG: hypothetical protein WCS47_04390 [Thermovirgaceae bacterium]|jgi:CHASE2 domain-containing sensor protein|nr:hypothetical protein [Synergistales bacterium]MDI9392859.1 hypothetical protein [Synergistota bacterium]MDY0178931.1 hypothetical protein [Synergistaceae bacterium]HRW87403.1 hypothetical protein [Thermovirgaceae bacterium]MDD3134836.1 hypothetical protein [Synergistales bacterium]
MFRIPLALTIVFFALSMVLGVMISRAKSRLPLSAFWGSLLLFLLFSSFSLYSYAPLWIAIAPLIPAAMVTLLFSVSRKNERNRSTGAEEDDEKS